RELRSHWAARIATTWVASASAAAAITVAAKWEANKVHFEVLCREARSDSLSENPNFVGIGVGGILDRHLVVVVVIHRAIAVGSARSIAVVFQTGKVHHAVETI